MYPNLRFEAVYNQQSCNDKSGEGPMTWLSYVVQCRSKQSDNIVLEYQKHTNLCELTIIMYFVGEKYSQCHCKFG